MDRLAERDVIRHGNDVWLYNSKDNTAAHAALPSGSAERHAPAQKSLPAPDTLAEELLAKLDQNAELTVGSDVKVAGRAAYQLVLTPRSAVTLLESVEISVDGQTGMPLGVELTARGQSAPAFQVAFTQLSLEAPDPAIFRFTPPAGAAVKELPVPEHKAPGATEPHQAKDGQHKVSGTGWESVIELPAGTWAKAAAQQPGQEKGQQQGRNPGREPGEQPGGSAASLLAQATVPVAGGRLLSTALVNVLILDDGRVFAGSVPLDRLQAAAAAG
jgi:outer membrane lipoprotein-sorting protein